MEFGRLFRCFVNRQRFRNGTRRKRRRVRDQIPTQSAIESLEQRCLLTADPTWDSVSTLTLSYAPDGTEIDGQVNSLTSTLNAVAPPAVWQKTILDAFQAWAVNSNINVGLVADDGEAFGAGGPTQGDFRFGDIRVGAVPMSNDVLAISIPRTGAISGTWVGDVLFNSNAQFDSLTEVYAIALHEAGHVFGLEHSSDTASPMFAHNDPSVSKTLTTGDIVSLQNLYGTRTPDLNDQAKSNGTMKTATTIRGNELTSGYTGATPLIAYGDVTKASDVDYFQLSAYTGYTGPVTFELRTAGISQLQANLSIYDQKGELVGQVRSQGNLNQDLTFHLASTDGTSKYYVRIDAGTSGLAAVGTYALVVKYDALLQTPETTIDAVARGHYDYLDTNDVQALLTPGTSVLLNDDRHTDDSAVSGRAMRSTAGFAKFTHYDTVASISDGADFDFYKVNTPKAVSGQPLVMTFTVRALETGGLLPALAVFDGSGKSVPVQVLANGLGVYTVQSTAMLPGKRYTLRVGAAVAQGPFSSGNYAMQVRFGTVAAELTPFVSGTLSASQSSAVHQLDVSQMQLFQFAMQSTGASTIGQVAIQMAVFNQQGDLIYQLVGPAGEMRSATSTLLIPGTYFVRMSAVSQYDLPIPAIGFQLMGTGLSDPIGPIPGDPTGSPSTGSNGSPGPTFTWQNGTSIAVPSTVGTTATNPWSALPAGTVVLFPWYWSYGLAGRL